MVRAEKDPGVYLRKVEYFLCHDKYSPDTTASERSGIRKSKKKFELHDGKMYYTATTKGSPCVDGPVRRLVLFTKAEQDAALEEAHDMKGAHQGQKRTLMRLNQDYYWTTMAQDVINWISTCHSCQTVEKNKIAAPELHSIKLSKRWEVLGIDFIGPLPVTEKGHKYICTLTDLFTKWVFARPIPTKSADALASVILELIYNYGPPDKIISDQGREFVNQVNSMVFDTFGVQHMVASAYHPQTRSQNERSNQTLKRALFKYTNEDQNDWDKYILSTTYGINTSVQSSTKQTPFFMMFYRSAPGAMALNTMHQSEDDQTYNTAITNPSPEDIQRQLEEAVAKVQDIDKQVTGHMEVAKFKRKRVRQLHRAEVTKNSKVTRVVGKMEFD